MKALVPLVAAALVSVALLSTAHADNRDEAKREFAAGQAADAKKDWQGAIEHYLRAYDLLAHPFALYNIAADYEQLGKLREAAHYYSEYLESPDSTDKDRVRKTLADLKDRPAKLTIRSEPGDARVTIDGQVVGATPYTGKIKGGSHQVVVDKGTRREEKQIDVQYGEPIDLAFSVGAGGTLFVDGTPVGATVQIDGSDAGTMPAQLPLDAGTHRVHVESPGYQAIDTTATIASGMVTRIQPHLVKGLDGTGGDGTNVIHAGYLLGVGGGADVRGNGSAFDFELGIRASRYELAVAIGRVAGRTSVEAQARWAPLEGRVTPIFGLGYSYLGNTDEEDMATMGSSSSSSSTAVGYEALAGARLMLVDGAKTGVSLMGTIAARYRGSDSSSSSSSATGYFPLMLKLQVSYR